MNHRLQTATGYSGLLFLAVAFVLLYGCAQPPDDFSIIVKQQLERHPAMEIRDLYKLAFHAAMGNEHIMTDTAMIRRYLVEELESVKADSSESLYEPLSGDGNLVRLNLAAYKSGFTDPDPIVRAMIRTAEKVQPSYDLLEQYWQTILTMAANNDIPFAPADLTPFWEHMRSEGYPPVHHSEIYRSIYRPAYRVLCRSELMLPDEK